MEGERVVDAKYDCMAALEIVWLHPDYRYSYQAYMVGRGWVWLTLRRQLRALNRFTATMHYRWQARALLQELYGELVFRLDPNYFFRHEESERH